MKIHSKQFGDGVVQIETGTKLPRGTPFTDGRIFFLNQEYETNPKGFYVYDATKAKWTLINDPRNLQITNMSTTEGIVYSLTAGQDVLGCTYATVTLSESTTHARAVVKGSGNGEALGFTWRNGDIGKDVLVADTEKLEYMEGVVWHEKNLNPNKFQPRQRAIDIRQNHMARSQEVLFVNTKAGEVLVKLPHIITVGDEVKIIDDMGTFGEHPCIVNGRGQNINGKAVDVRLDKPNGRYTLIYQNGNRGWRLFED